MATLTLDYLVDYVWDVTPVRCGTKFHAGFEPVAA